jgi:predicted deacylase
MSARPEDAPSEALFSQSYREAQSRFCGATHAAGFELRSHPIDARGPAGEPLAIDVALLAQGGTQRTLVISSGTHGVEGYFGSAVQLALLQDGALLARAKQAASLVLIHAVNPYGFAHARRCNENNVDQNRNFVLDGARFAGAPAGYGALDDLLNPRTPPSGLDAFYLRAAAAIARAGFRELKNAVAQGQYEFPRGLFFGGTEPSQSQRILRAELAGWLGSSRRVLQLDLHTGVGKWGTYALCVDLPESHARVAQLKREFAASTVQAFDPSGVLYEIRGALGPWLEQCAPGVQYDCLLSEFGTYQGLRVLAALRYENRVHHYAPGDAALEREARLRMVEAFCPRAISWRRLVIQRALGVIGEAVHALGAGG